MGNIRTALFNYLMARGHGGVFIVRIEDTDKAREVEGAVEEILESLRWLGMDWDEGPEKGGEFGPYSQSERLGTYREYCDELLEKGAAYKCFCTTEELSKMREYQRLNKLPTGYDRRCRFRDRGEIEQWEKGGKPFVIRLAMPLDGLVSFDDAVRGRIETEGKLVDDQVLLKSDGWPTYHLANVVDDHLMGITHVIRGEEWISSTPKHVALYQALDWELPVFAHAPVIKGPDGAKLSKRHGDTRCLDYREKGYMGQAVANFIALIGWSPGGDREIMSLGEMAEAFSVEGIQPSPGVFDITKLQWMNGHYIRSLSPADLFQTVKEFDETSSDEEYLSKPARALLQDGFSQESGDYVAGALLLEQERVKLLSDFAEAAGSFFTAEPEMEQKGVDKWLTRPHVGPLIGFFLDWLKDADSVSKEECEAAIDRAADALSLEKRAHAIHPTRVALTGRTSGPGLFELMALLGPERMRKRLERAKRFVKPAAAAETQGD